MCEICDHPRLEEINVMLREKDALKASCVYCGEKFRNALGANQHRRHCSKRNSGIFGYTWDEIAAVFGVTASKLRYHGQTHVIGPSYSYKKRDTRPADRRSDAMPPIHKNFREGMRRVHRSMRLFKEQRGDE